MYEAFFKSYTEKVWGTPCDQISAEWAAQRIKGLSFRTVVTEALIGDRGKKLKSLIDEFQYPHLGPGELWERVQQRVLETGGEVHLNQAVRKINRDGPQVLGFTVENGGVERFVEGSQHIASMPITHVVNRLDPPPPAEVLDAAAQLKYRDFLTVCVIVDQADVFDDNWIYIHDPGVRMGRLQNFKNWSAAMVPDTRKTSLGAEYFVSHGDDLWEMADEDLVALAARELEEIGIVSADLVEAGVVYRQRYAYPVYDQTYKQYLDVLESFFKGLNNFQLIGRNGLHKYNNQDHSMLTAILAVQNIYGASHDIWMVNTDEQYHEEAVESED